MNKLFINPKQLLNNPLSSGLSKAMFILFWLSFVFTSSYGQSTQISGTVTSSQDGMGLPGVSVVVKGSTVGTVTDLDGNYSLSVPQESTTLVYSFVGMMTIEEEIAGRTVINVVLDPDKVALDEVMVVAYGTTTKEAFTGSAEVIGAKDLESRQVTSAINAIDGTTAGVQVVSASGQPGSSPSIVIRGVGTLNGGIDPLYIVDGVQYEGSIANLSSDDIESMTVLKDAASTALYGSRAANGVVLITTKKGKGSSGIKVTASASTGVISQAIPYYDRVSPGEYYELMWEGYKNSLIDIEGGVTEADAATEASATIYNRLGYNPFNVANDQIVGTDGKLNPNAQVIAKSLDWYEEMEQQGKRENYNLSVAAGSEDYNLYFSTSYLDETGYIITSAYDRFSTRLNTDFHPTKWLSVGANMNVVMTNTEGPSAAGSSSIVNPFGFAKNMGSIYPVYVVDPATGDYILDDAGEKQYDFGGGYNEYGIAPRPNNQGRHAIAEAMWNKETTEVNNLSSRYYAQFTLLPELKLTVNYGLDVNDYINKDYENHIVGDGAPTARYSELRFRRTVENFNQILTYTKSLNDLHNFDITLGHENFDRHYSEMDGMKNTQTAIGIQEFDNFATTSNLSGYSSDKRTEGYFARLNYNFNSKYYLTASIRRDGSSVFDADVRWGNFYSVGGSWILSEESFVKSISFIDNLKLRASYGQVGNDNLGDYFISQPRYSLFPNAGDPGIYWSDLGNDQLTWETSSSWDVALEYRLFGNLLEGSIEYWERNSTDLLYNVPLPLSVGLSRGPDNIASIVNKGIEFNLTANIIRTNDFRWSVNFNASTQNNEITDLPDPFVDGSKRWEVGRSRYDFFIYHYAGVDPDNGDALYYMFEENVDDNGYATYDPVLDADGNHMTTTDYQEAGKAFADKNTIPDLFGGLSTRVYYKNFELNILFKYRMGGYVLDYGYANLMHEGEYGQALHPDLLNGWRTAGDITDVPRMEYGNPTLNQTLSTRYLTDASYFSLQNVSLSYTFNQAFVENLGIQDFRVFVSGENLFTNTARNGLNPQYNLSGTPDGEDFNPMRVISAGVNVAF